MKKPCLLILILPLIGCEPQKMLTKEPDVKITVNRTQVGPYQYTVQVITVNQNPYDKWVKYAYPLVLVAIGFYLEEKIK